jgi:hypothetical protein
LDAARGTLLVAGYAVSFGMLSAVSDPNQLAHGVRVLLANASLYAAAALRVRAEAGRSIGRPGAGEERLVFVVGSPRSGTTFTARALGSLPGFLDLGEVKPLKAAIPWLAGDGEQVVAGEVRMVLERVRKLSLTRHLRCVEQTPETSFVLPAALRAYPDAVAVHVLRDGRDVVCSLLERGWLSSQRDGADDVGAPFGAYPRFWVEPERREEFERASDATRAAWAWRRYATAAAAAPERTAELRYELLATDPGGAAARVADRLGTDPEPLARAFAAAHDRSLGRWRHDLRPEQLADVEREAGPLLRELGYD